MSDAYEGRPGVLVDSDATGASPPLPPPDAEGVSREAQEREAAYARGRLHAGRSPTGSSATLPPSGVVHHIFRMLADNVREYAIFLLDVNGIITYWGEGARLLKWWTKHQMEGGHLRLLYPDGGSEDGTAEAHLQHAADTGEYSGEGHRIRSDGSTFWAAVTLTALRDHNGALVGFAKVARDFSARRAVEATLRRHAAAATEGLRVAEEANHLKSLFVATVSHEVRGPLNAILGYTAVLSGDLAPQRRRDHVAGLQRAAQHLQQIMNDVLDLSRAEAGTFQVTSAAKRLGPALGAAIEGVEAAARARGVRLVNAVSGAGADLPYWGDEVRVQQVVGNLLTNAIKCTEPHGQITLSAGTADQALGSVLVGGGPWRYVRVEDTGRGIPRERLETVFEPYEQTSAGDRETGAGLGLSISRRLARLMAGDLTVQSEVGVGSTFTLWLPIMSADRVPR